MAVIELPWVVVVMGVAGCGKTTVGRQLAAALNAIFEEGDAYHSAANIAKMRRGQPLTDADRGPWLDRLGAAITDWVGNRRRTVLACSALKESYRARLHIAQPGVALVFLSGSVPLILSRLAARTGHYMPASLLPSQLATLEAPDDAITVDIAAPPDHLVATIIAALKSRAGR